MLLTIRESQRWMDIVFSAKSRDFSWNFPVELDADNIVVPQMTDWPKSTGDGYTLGSDRKFCLFLGRGKRHLETLYGEVMPKTRRAGIPTAIVHLENGTFATDDHIEPRPVRDLPNWLNRCLNDKVFAVDAFKNLEGGWPALQYRLKPEYAQVLTQHPLRLWEALIWRGFDGRRNMLAGEQVLQKDFVDQEVAEINLRSLLSDGERLEQSSATYQNPWWKVGRFRFRLNSSQLEMRVRLRPQDRRVIHEPQHYLPGAKQSTDLVGMLLTGGGEGKTELLSGWTPCLVFVHPQESPEGLTQGLSDQIQNWVGEPVEFSLGWASPMHQEPLNRWLLSFVPASKPEPIYQGFMSAYMPMHRENLLPWKVYADDFLERTRK